MKKQILLLTILVFALLSSTINVFGQAVKYSDPRPVSCADDALHPIAGREYTYSATGTPSGGNFTFWATKDPTFISMSGGNRVFNNTAPNLLTTTNANQLVSTSTNYNDPDEQDNVKIIWSSALLANTTYQTNPTFVAVYYEDPTGCSDNFKVYELDPIHAFTVDVLSLDPSTFLPADTNPYDFVPEQCSDDVSSATYSGGTMSYLYGEQYLYFEFIASNFTQSWTPTFELTGINGVQTMTYEYTYDLPTTWNASTTWTPLISGNTSITTNLTDTKNGASVFVRVRLTNNNYENLAGQTVTMVLDGQNAEGLWDVVNDTCVNPGQADQNDKADQVIKPRPTITPTTTGSPAPNTTIVSGNEQN